jgi:hypothetical protein
MPYRHSLNISGYIFLHVFSGPPEDIFLLRLNSFKTPPGIVFSITKKVSGRISVETPGPPAVFWNEFAGYFSKRTMVAVT